MSDKVFNQHLGKHEILYPRVANIKRLGLASRPEKLDLDAPESTYYLSILACSLHQQMKKHRMF